MMCVFDSIELEPGATRTPEINPVNIINHEQQNEKPAASQFFRSLLGLPRRQSNQKARIVARDRFDVKLIGQT
jgi:hypothetical protein